MRPWLKFCLGISSSLMLLACSTEPQTEALPMAKKLRWYWVGSVTYTEHIGPASNQEFWIELHSDQAEIHTPCIQAVAKAKTSAQGRLWLTNIATTQVRCAASPLESVFLMQLTRANITEQWQEVLRIRLDQTADSMHFSHVPYAHFHAYRCSATQAIAAISTPTALSVWVNDQFSQLKAENAPAQAAASANAASSTQVPETLIQSETALTAGCPGTFSR